MTSPKDYFDLVKAIGESKSKQEEDRIVMEEVIFIALMCIEVFNVMIFAFDR